MVYADTARPHGPHKHVLRFRSPVPFADHRIIEYVFNVPWEMKYQNGVEKALLRDACKDLLPAELLHRKKSPYPKTYHPGYEKLLISEMVTSSTSRMHRSSLSSTQQNSKTSYRHRPNTESLGSDS